MRMIVKKISVGIFLLVLAALTHSVEAQSRGPLFYEAVGTSDYQRAGCDGASAPIGQLPLYKPCSKPRKLLNAALKNAKKAKAPLLVVWGFDECAVCRQLEKTLTGDDKTAAFSSSLFTYSLSPTQMQQIDSGGLNQRVMLLRLKLTGPEGKRLARSEGLFELADKMGRDKLWSPIMTFYNPKTKKWVSRSAYSGFEKPCRLGDEIALALEDLGYIPKDPSKMTRMCKSS